MRKKVTMETGARLNLSANEIEDGTCAEAVAEDGRVLAVCNVDGDYYGVSSECPHAGAPLGEGLLDGNVLTCPWHEWSFNIKLGESINQPNASVDTYDISVHNGQLFIED